MTAVGSGEPRGWGRLYTIAKPFTSPMLRHGAWYLVVDDLGRRLVLVVKGRRVAVPRHLLEIRERRPDRFTVVYRGRDEVNPAYGTPGNVGRIYAVCPASGCRVPLFGEPNQLICPTCGHKGEVAWWETG